jgi:hypothetical protein
MRLGSYRGTLRQVMSRVAAHARGRELDELLATGLKPCELGLDPAMGDLCQTRARLLRRRSFRLILAQELEDVLRLAGAGAAADPIWTIDLQLDQVREATAALQQVIAALRSREPPEAHGIALAVLLLRDGRSPLYDRRAHGGLRLAAEAAAHALVAPSRSTPHALAAATLSAPTTASHQSGGAPAVASMRSARCRSLPRPSLPTPTSETSQSQGSSL